MKVCNFNWFSISNSKSLALKHNFIVLLLLLDYQIRLTFILLERSFCFFRIVEHSLLYYLWNEKEYKQRKTLSRKR